MQIKNKKVAKRYRVKIKNHWGIKKYEKRNEKLAIIVRLNYLKIK